MVASSQYLCALCGAPCCSVTSPGRPHACNAHFGDDRTLQDSQSVKGQQKRACMCSSCGAMYYCSEAHRRRHAMLPGGHSPEECMRMAGQLRRAAELENFPFSWFRIINPCHPSPSEHNQGHHPLRRRLVAPPPPPLPLCSLLSSLWQKGRDPFRSEDPPWNPPSAQPALLSTPPVEDASGSGSGSGVPGNGGDHHSACRSSKKQHDGNQSFACCNITTSSCMAPGCWRRLCTCDGGGRGGGPSGPDEVDWGSLQEPVMAHVKRPGQSQPTATGQKPLQCQAEWSGRVWHLPMLLAPPLLVSEERCGRGPLEAQKPQIDPWVSGSSSSVPTQKVSQLQQQPRLVLLDDNVIVENGNVDLYGPYSVVDWLSYYRWAGLPLESPAALLLHFPLTLYGALRLVDEHLGGALLRLWGAAERVGAGHPDLRRLCVDVLYLGPQSELDQLDTFAVLLPLLPPGCTLRLHMVGPDVPDHLHGTVLVYDGQEWGIGGEGLPTSHPAHVRTGRLIDHADATVLHRGGKGGCAPAVGVVSRAAGVDEAGSPRLDGNPARPHPGNAVGALCPRLEVLLHSCLLHEAEWLLDGVDVDDEPWVEDSGGDIGGGGGCTSMVVTTPTSAIHTAPAAEAVDSGSQSSPGHWPGLAAIPRPVSSQPATGGAAFGATPHCQQEPAPLVVFAPNAGLPVYLSWLPSLELLLARQKGRSAGQHGRGHGGAGPGSVQAPAEGMEKAVGAGTVRAVLAAPRGSLDTAAGAEPRCPLACLFTAYNEEECVRSCQLLEQLYNIQPDVRCTVNPYRQPLCCIERVGNGLPSYSNGFMYGWFSI